MFFLPIILKKIEDATFKTEALLVYYQLLLNQQQK